ncbi:MAG TPA: S8 family serine peptidase [Gammaproteobacteria bacterium]
MKNFKLAAACCGVALVFALNAANADDKVRVYVGFKNGQKNAVEHSLKSAGGQLHHSFEKLNAFAVSVPSQALKGLQNNPNVLYVEEDPKRFLMSETQPYGIAMVQADDLALQPASANRTVCIIDSGYSLGHEDLPSNNVNGTNDSGTGNWFTDENHHGTHVAGTIAAVAGNNTGVVGVFRNQNVNIHIIKVFGADGWAYSSSLVTAAQECEAAGANVISMSLGGSMSSRAEDRYFADAYNRGVLSIAAAGNDGNTRKSYPASYASVMSVAAVDQNKAVADFSQKNDAVEIAAPGVGVKSTVPMGSGSEASVTVGSQGFDALGMEGTPTGSASGALVDCGLGASACPGGGGQVCLIQRGDIAFADKVLACQAGGGVAAVVYNNEAGPLSGTLGETATGIPSVGVSDTQGAALMGMLGQSATVFVGAGNYAFFDGTSMATPHVSAVAALAWSNNLGCTNDDVRNALNATAEDLGTAGRDNETGYGLVQARAASDYLAANCGGGGGGDPDPEPGTLDLSANAYKVKGKQRVDLSWSGATSSSVDIFRDGGKIVTTANDGAYTDNLNVKGGGSYTYKVCEAGTSTCSADVNASF